LEDNGAKAASNGALGVISPTQPSLPMLSRVELGKLGTSDVGREGLRSFRSVGTRVGHFFINFHGGTRTMNGTNIVPGPSPSPSLYPPPTRSMLQYENVENRNDGKNGEKGKAENVTPATELWVCFVQMSRE